MEAIAPSRWRLPVPRVEVSVGCTCRDGRPLFTADIVETDHRCTMWAGCDFDEACEVAAVLARQVGASAKPLPIAILNEGRHRARSA